MSKPLQQTESAPWSNYHDHHEPERVCRICGCTEMDACLKMGLGPCWWVEVDLCSHCKYWPGESIRYSENQALLAAEEAAGGAFCD